MKKRRLCVPMQPEWLEGALPGRVQIHASGTTSVLAENYVNVAEFTPERVSLRGKGGLYRVLGEALTISELRPGSLIVRGTVKGIVFPGGEEK